MGVPRFLLAVLGAIVLTMSLGGAQAGAADTAHLVLILDASGSMWGQIDGKAKIQIAKEVMGDLTDKMPADFEVGLMAYGHRRKGDCKDIEMLAPIAPSNATAMKAKIEAINPKGMTPISDAVRQAAQALRYKEKRATVILVSDGLETCDQDPCALASELAMSGVDFTVHVIGFDISKAEQGRLRCLADKTGGLFLAADNAGQLRKALFQTVEEVKAPPAAVVKDPGTAELKAPAKVPAGSDFSVQWKGPDSRGDYITVVEKKSRDLDHVDYAYTKRGNPSGFTAPGKTGAYELRYVHAQSKKVIGRADIEVMPVQATVTVPAEADVATTIDVKWQGPAYTSDYITIARPDREPSGYNNYSYTSAGSPLKLQAPSDPGTYEVRYILGKDDVMLAKTSIQIKGVSAAVQAPAAADVATAFEVTWQGPGHKSDYVSIAKPEDEPAGYEYYTHTSEGSPLKLQAPATPGTYEVRYILGQDNKLLAKTTIEIKGVSASVRTSPAADMGSEFDVTWQGPGNAADYISIAKPEDEPAGYEFYTSTSEGSPLKLQAPSSPGTFEVRYILGQENKMLAKTTIQIKRVTAKISAPATAVRNTAFEVRWQGPGYKPDFICVSQLDQDPGDYVNYNDVGTGNPVMITAPDEPGTYEVRYILGNGNIILDKATIVIK